MPTGFQSKLYYFVENYLKEHHTAPTFIEMIKALGIGFRSKSLITRSLRQLQKEGKVELEKNGRRLLITLPKKGLKILGRISSGASFEMGKAGLLNLNALFQRRECVALQVTDGTLIKEGILSGDVLICQKPQDIKEGDLVVALIDQQQLVLKYISYPIKGMVLLKSIGPGDKPHIYCAHRVSIHGAYVGLIRGAFIECSQETSKSSATVK